MWLVFRVRCGLDFGSITATIRCSSSQCHGLQDLILILVIFCLGVGTSLTNLATEDLRCVRSPRTFGMDSGGWRLFLRLLAANNFFSIEVYMGKRSRPLANINPSQLFQYLFVVFYPLVSFSCSAGFSFLYKLKSRSEDLCQYITAEPGSLQLQKKKAGDRKSVV